MGAACGCASKKASYDGRSASVVSNKGGVQVGGSSQSSGPGGKGLVRLNYLD